MSYEVKLKLAFPSFIKVVGSPRPFFGTVKLAEKMDGTVVPSSLELEQQSSHPDENQNLQLYRVGLFDDMVQIVVYPP